ncbi:MAG: sensor histidine kinase [Alphaproteobacteria bacterium]
MAASKPSPASRETARNRARAERRRSVRQTVNEQRERLGSSSGNPLAYDQELTLTYTRNRLSASYVMPLLVALVAGTSLPWTALWPISVWAAGVITAHVMTTMLCRRYLAIHRDNQAIETWRRRFVAAELVTGIAWAALFVVTPFSANTPGLDTFQFAAMLVVVSATTSLASTVPLAAIAGAAPVTLALVAVFLGHGELFHAALALLALCALIFFLLLSARLYSATLSMLEYRAEKDLLIAELSTAKSISDESRRRAEEANLAKSRFLATMSHELRTPLNAILGFSEIINKEVLGPIGHDSYKEYVGDIHDSGQYLLNLINEILDLSRIEAGRRDLNEEPVDVVAVVAECHRLMQVKSKSKDIKVSEDFQANLPKLWADERAVRQIVLNLLSNALKFTPKGGEICLQVRETEDGGQTLAVIDNGPGIPEEEIPIVLSSFGQGAIAISNAEPGAGLGLAIVQALVKTHDGTFELTSKLRQGTEARATFPASRAMEALAPYGSQPRMDVKGTYEKPAEKKRPSILRRTA